MLVGLFFFIRASVKDRTQQVKLLATAPQESLLPQIQTYFEQRAYRIKEVDSQQNRMDFEGFVQPSWFLAIFLSLLAGCGWLCLALVLSVLYPSSGHSFLLLILLTPVAGLFYWRKAGRLEQISLEWEVVNEPSQGEPAQSIITIKAHRDELNQLQKNSPISGLEQSIS